MWPTARLGDITTKIGSGATPRGGTAVYTQSQTALIRSQNVLDNSMTAEGLAHISNEAAATLASVSVEKGDVLLNITGDSVARCCLVEDRFLPARVNQHVAIIRASEQLSPRFLQRALVNPGMKNHLLAISSGGTRKALTKSMLEELHVPLPPLPEQQAIAEVLGALDDKIDANQALIRTTAQLTKTSFEKLTAGCAWRGLSEFAIINGDTVSMGTGQLRYLDIAAVATDGYTSPSWSDWETAPSRARRRVHFGDTIWSTVRPNRRARALVLEDGPALIASTGLVTLTPRHRGFSYLHEATRTNAFAEYLVANAEGSAYPAVTAGKFHDAPVPKLAQADVDQFNVTIDPLWLRAASAQRESATLAALRDTLLPALMDGTLRVKDAITAAEEVL